MHLLSQEMYKMPRSPIPNNEPKIGSSLAENSFRKQPWITGLWSHNIGSGFNFVKNVNISRIQKCSIRNHLQNRITVFAVVPRFHNISEWIYHYSHCMFKCYHEICFMKITGIFQNNGEILSFPFAFAVWSVVCWGHFANMAWLKSHHG